MKIRSFASGNEIADWTEELLVVPNVWGTIGGLGLFTEEGVSEHVVQFEEITTGAAVLVDTVRGHRGTTGKERTSKIRSWAVPHFDHRDAISPSDIKGKRAYGKADAEDTLADARARKMQDIAKVHSDTLELARAKLITTGDVYAPNGTVALNFFTEFGISQTSVDFVLGTGTTDIIGKGETAIAAIQDNASGSPYDGYIALCGSTFFSRLIAHAKVQTAYTYRDPGNQDILRNRLGGKRIKGRVFEFGGITYVEMRDVIAGQTLIPATECYIVPSGSDIFKTYFSPANKFSFLNTVGERMYMFEKMVDDEQYQIDTETNFLNACRRPAMIIKGTTSN